jgi:glycosyltransferase involved in cell wall biosynthesis
MSVKIEPNHPDCRLISKEPLRAILDHSEKTLFLRGLIHTIGYKVARVELKTHPRFAGETKYTMGKMINFSIDGITSSTAFPLRIIFISGLVIALLSFLMILYIIISKLLGMTLPGWTSIVVPIYFLGGIQLIFMGVIGEYLSKVFSEVKNRPHYIVSDKI